MKDLEYIKTILDEKADRYNQSDFIADDPISIPHQFSRKADIEIIGFLVAIIAWGNRRSIIQSGQRLVEIMKGEPYEYIQHYHSNQKLEFVHRTFNAEDLDFFFRSLQHIYQNHGGLEYAFTPKTAAKDKILSFRKLFLQTPHAKRSEKHVANPEKGSSAKRINIFFRVFRVVNYQTVLFHPLVIR